MLEIIGDLLVIAQALALLVHFSLIWRYGWILIGEPRPWVLAIETAMCVVFIIIGANRLYRDTRGKGAKQK